MLIFSTDIDHTLYEKGVDQRSFKRYWHSLGRSREKAPILVYNSGRNIKDVRSLISAEDLLAPDYIIGAVGTEIYDVHNNQIFSDWSKVLETDWDVEKVTEVCEQYLRVANKQPDEYQSEHKVSWYLKDSDFSLVERLRKEFKKNDLSVQIVYSSGRDLDFIPKNANKGNALNWLKKKINQPGSPCLVAGDSMNDYSMFQQSADYGIVVANADDQLLEFTNSGQFYLSPYDATHGVVDGLKYFLNRINLMTA